MIDDQNAGRTDTASKRSRESYDKLLDGLPVGIQRIDMEGVILYSNRAHHKMLGYPMGELIGKSIHELMADPEWAAAFGAELIRMIRDRPEPAPWFGVSRRLDGSTFDARADWQYEFDESGELTGFVAVVTDVTEQRRAEAERDETLVSLEENRRHAASLMESATGFVLYRIAISEVSPFAGQVVFVSPSIREVMGVEDPTDFPSWFVNILPEDLERVTEANRLSAEIGEPFDEVMRIRHPGHSEVRWVRAMSRPILSEDGVPQFFNGLIVDITRERRAEEQRQHIEQVLQQRQRLESLGTLAGGIAHDFNNLLVGILGSAELALGELGEKEATARPYIEDLVTASERAAELTNQLLAYSGQSAIQTELADLNAVIEELKRILATVISKKARLELVAAGSLPMVQADVSQIRQVLMNLITNASDALRDEPGTIRIETSTVDVDAGYPHAHGLSRDLAPGEYVKIEVVDTGHGMDPSTLERLFDPFYSTKESGRGLGLAAVRGIVDGHAGAIHVESSPGSGSRFAVLLPAAGPSSEEAPTVEVAAETPRSAPLKVLIIDDEDLVRSVATQVLSKRGHEVLSASDGQEGLKVCAEHVEEIDVVLLDLNMPRMSGAETFEKLRQLAPRLPVVLSTGYLEHDVDGLLSAHDGVDFIHKPYRGSELLEKVTRLSRWGGDNT